MLISEPCNADGPWLESRASQVWSFLSKPKDSQVFHVHCGCLQETIDGDLAVRVFGLLPVVDSGYHQGRYGERSRQRLDLAILSLFQSFRKVYIGEQVMHSSKVSSCPVWSWTLCLSPIFALPSTQDSLNRLCW